MILTHYNKNFVGQKDSLNRQQQRTYKISQHCFYHSLPIRTPFSSSQVAGDIFCLHLQNFFWLLLKFQLLERSHSIKNVILKCFLDRFLEFLGFQLLKEKKAFVLFLAISKLFDTHVSFNLPVRKEVLCLVVTRTKSFLIFAVRYLNP